MKIGVSGGCIRRCDRRRRAPGRPAAQASPRCACERAEISFGLKVEDYRRGRTGAIEF
jgi:hypothetical protein